MMQIESILEKQREELEIKERIIRRDVEEELKKWLDKEIIKVITGMRRVGKSTLAKYVLKGKDVGYVNFDDERLLNRSFDEIIKALKNVYGNINYLFFDEIQNVKNWELVINRLHRENYNIIITGSNAKLLSKELSSHLTGRYIEIKVYPFSYREWLRAKKLPVSLDSLKKYITEGGMPEVVVKNFDIDYLKMLEENIISNDVVLRYKLRDKAKIKSLSYYLFSTIGSPLSYKKIANVLGISPHTVERYILYIEESFLISRCSYFSYKTKEQIKRPNKFYSIDTGITKAKGFLFSSNIGRFMENVVAIELLRRKQKLFYYKDKTQKEIDFITDNKKIQVSYKTKEREIRNFNIINDKRENLLITWNEEGVLEKEWFGKKIIVNKVPLYKWLVK